MVSVNFFLGGVLYALFDGSDQPVSTLYTFDATLILVHSLCLGMLYVKVSRL